MGRMVGSIVTLVILVTLLLGAGVPADAIAIAPRGGQADQGQARGSDGARAERDHDADDKHRKPVRGADGNRQKPAHDRDRDRERDADDKHRERARDAADNHRRPGRDAADDRGRARDAADDRGRARDAADDRQAPGRDADDDRGRARDEAGEPADRGRGRTDGRDAERPAGSPDRASRAAAPEPTPSRSREGDVAPGRAPAETVTGDAPEAGTGDEDDAASVPDPRTLRLLGLGGYLTGGPGRWGGQPESGPMFGVPGLPRTIGGLPVLLALLGAFLALQRGIGNGLGHVPMDPTSPEPDTHVHR